MTRRPTQPPGSDTPGGGESPPQGRLSTGTRRRRRWPLIVSASVVALLLMVGSFYAIRSLAALSDIKRDESLMPSGSRPQTVAGREPVNFVLMGSDSLGDQRGRSDSLIIAHLNRNRDKVYLISFPRDLYVEIPAHGENKINAAFALGGMPLTIETLESLLDVRMQHAAVMDLDGFIGLTDVLGGVTVFNKYEFTSTAYGGTYDFPQGNITVQGNEALAYVRDRFELASGDLGRAERQRAVVKALALNLVRPEVIANPVTFNEVASRLGKYFSVDSGLTNDVLWQLALELKVRGTGDIVSLQAPILGYSTASNGGSVDLVDHHQMADLATAMRDDTMESYVAKYDNSLEAVGAATAENAIYLTQPSSNTVTVIDAATKGAAATVQVGDGPQEMVLDPSSHSAYVTNGLSDSVTVIDTSTRTVTASIPVGSRPSGIAVDSGSHRVFVANTYGSTVSVIDQSNGKVTGSISVENPWSLAVDSVNHRLYVSSKARGLISVVDTGTERVTSTMEVGDAPLRIALDGSTNTLYAANRTDGSVSVIDTVKAGVAATIKVGDWPQAITVDPGSHRAVVTNQLSDTVTVIDTTTNTVIATRPVDPRPTGLAVDPSSHNVYVAHSGSDAISVITP